MFIQPIRAEQGYLGSGDDVACLRGAVGFGDLEQFRAAQLEIIDPL